MRALPAFVGQARNISGRTESRFDDIFVGYLGNISMLEEVRILLRRKYPEAYVLVDPIMADHGVILQELHWKPMENHAEALSAVTLLRRTIRKAVFWAGENV